MKMQVQRVKLTEIHEDPANTRKHGARNLATITASLSKFGQVEPLVVQKTTGTVIGGNGRLAAMRAMGWEEVDVVLLDLTDIQAAALSITLNRSAELAEWDLEALGRVVATVKGDYDLSELGWEPYEFEPKAPPAPGEGVGLGMPIVQYALIFDNEGQQERFHAFLKALKAQEPDAVSIADRIDRFLERTRDEWEAANGAV